jgi:hypothetical protein
MLRPDETRLTLWIPAGAEYQIRVFNQRGLLKSGVAREDSSISVGLERQSAP